MHATSHQKPVIGLISPFPPPLGGMAIQATKLEKNFKAEGFHFLRVPTNIALPARLSFLDRTRFIRTLARSVVLLLEINRQSRSIDVFYFLTGFFGFFFWVTVPVLLLLKLKRKPVILSARGGEAGRFFRKWKMLVKPVLKLAEKITVPSGFLGKDFKEILGMKTVIVPNIADTAQFVYRERKEFKPKLIVTRHLEKIYDIETVIRAFSLICAKYPEATLTIAGDGPERLNLEELATNLGVENNVLFLGAVPHDELPALYAQNDIFVNASRIDNLPGAILEAFASGLPVVSTNSGGIPFLVTHGHKGFLVNVGDAEGLAQRVLEVTSCPETGQIVARNALEALQAYSWQNIRRSLLPLLLKSRIRKKSIWNKPVEERSNQTTARYDAKVKRV